MKKSRPELPIASPIPFHTGSNGEFAPRPKTAKDRLADKLFDELSDQRARKLGISRRDFVGSVLGTSTALMVMNQVYGCGEDGNTSGSGDGAGGAGGGGGFGVGGDGMDAGEQCETLMGDEFIFDVQTHHVNPDRFLGPGWDAFLGSIPQGGCGEMDPVDCFSTEHYLRELFINSQTSVAVLSALPGPQAGNALTPDEMRETTELVNLLAESERCVMHAIINPTDPDELDAMEALAADYPVGAWKVYTQVDDWSLDDPAVGIPFIERARSIGVNTICAHKGLPISNILTNEGPEDIGVVAAAYPEMNFIVYHSAFLTDHVEGEFDPMGPGIDRLIKAAQDNNIPRNTGNIYAELGSTWRFLMTQPDAAAHAIGKLLLHLGEDRIVWGTDSIWYGDPQDQIDAFRAFEISTMFQETYGYPALTPEIKAKIFGLTSAGIYGIDPEAKLCAIKEDQLAVERRAMLEDPSRKIPSYKHRGPRSKREWMDFLRVEASRNG